MSINDYITIDPNVCHGQPCFKGTRIMIYLILEMMGAGETTQDIITAYPELSREAIGAALMFAAKAAAVGERYVPFSIPPHAEVSH